VALRCRLPQHAASSGRGSPFHSLGLFKIHSGNSKRMFEVQVQRTKASGFAQGPNQAQAATFGRASAGFASGHTLVQAKRAVRLPRPAHNRCTCTFMLGSAASQAQQPVMQARRSVNPKPNVCKGFQAAASSPFLASATSLTFRSSGRQHGPRPMLVPSTRCAPSGAAYLGR
jgi:hypothetical protein